MKVGDLVKQISWDGIGIVLRLWGDKAAASVLFAGGEYNFLVDDLEVVSESR